MTKSYKLISVLTMTAILSGLLLSFLNLHTKPLIEAHQNNVLNSALSSVLPNSVKTEEKIIENQQFYFGYNKQGSVNGIAFLAEGNGFQSKLRILVGMDETLTKIVKIKILEQKETPGLGTKIETDPNSKSDPEWFPNQFDNLNVRQSISYVKNQEADNSNGEIMAITGATISSIAVVDIINATLNKNREIIRRNTDLAAVSCPAVAGVPEDEIIPNLIAEDTEIIVIEGKSYYINRDNSGKVTGVAFTASGVGFQSRIKVLVCMNPDFSEIQSLRILEQNETPGCGTRIIKDIKNETDQEWFIKQFNGLKVTQPVTCVEKSPKKSNGEVQAISGATVSSETIVDILNNSIQNYRDSYLLKFRRGKYIFDN
ncbi:FMN-binding protein [bacterium]|nr:FMN-binding protein [bacterium]